ncbi:DEP domain-containing protein 1A-like, partial [Homarus americanus]|uniref:DEP domain-containing protein 1A-like n=1 Tax=Homarus americanus TaxID=6706 RepID=UPI001C467520
RRNSKAGPIGVKLTGLTSGCESWCWSARFSNRSPLKALRTPRTPGRSVLGNVNNSASSCRPNQDVGASPVLRKRTLGSLREPSKGTQNEEGGREGEGSLRTKNRPKRMASIHSGENAVNEVKDRGGMQECHLVAKQLSKAETNDVWKHVLLGKLDSVCERLLFGDTSCILDPRVVEGEWVHHNMTRVTSRGVVLAPDGHPDDLPNWILTAMKCMAH